MHHPRPTLNPVLNRNNPTLSAALSARAVLLLLLLLVLSTSALTTLTANEAHTSDFPHLNTEHAGVFLGTTVEADTTPTTLPALGLDYTHHAAAFHGLFSVGITTDALLGPHPTLAAVPHLLLHATHDLKFGAGFGVETDLHRAAPTMRGIAEYDVHVTGQVVLIPTASAEYDALHHSARLALGLTAGLAF